MRLVSTWLDPEAFRSRVFVAYTLAVGFQFFAFYPLLFHINEWASQDKFQNIPVVWYLAMVNGYVSDLPTSARVLTCRRSSAIGRLGSGYLASLKYVIPDPTRSRSCKLTFQQVHQSIAHSFGQCPLGNPRSFHPLASSDQRKSRYRILCPVWSFWGSIV